MVCYRVRVIERLAKLIEIPIGEDVTEWPEAIDKADEMVNREDVVLTADDFYAREYEPAGKCRTILEETRDYNFLRSSLPDEVLDMLENDLEIYLKSRKDTEELSPAACWYEGLWTTGDLIENYKNGKGGSGV